MEKNFELIHQRGPFGDGTSIYKLQINKEGYTIHELIQDAVSRRNEWGQVEVLVGKKRYVLEYKWGNIVEDHIPAELRTAVIDKETATAHGGWSLMNYIICPTAEQLKNKRATLQQEQPAEWSDADEEMLDAMIDIVSNSLYEPLCPREGMLAWLKSLRPRPHWKPSEVQPEVDLKNEYKEYVDTDPVLSKLVNHYAGMSIARHFYELGLNARKEGAK